MFYFDLIFCSKKYALKVPKKTTQMKSDANIFGSYIARAFVNHYPLVHYQGRYIYFQFCSIKWCSSVWCKGIKSHDFNQYTVQYMWFLKSTLVLRDFRFGFYSALFWVQLLEYKSSIFVRNNCVWEEDLWLSALLQTFIYHMSSPVWSFYWKVFPPVFFWFTLLDPIYASLSFIICLLFLERMVG